MRDSVSFIQLYQSFVCDTRIRSAMEPELIEARAQVKEMNKDLKLFWIPCGNMDFLLEKNELAHATMTKLEINHEYVLTEGDNHSWPVWRRYLIEFLPKIFRD